MGRVKHQTKNPNSNLDSAQCRERGLCTDCGGVGYWTNFGDPVRTRWRHVRCGKCGA